MKIKKNTIKKDKKNEKKEKGYPWKARSMQMTGEKYKI